MDDHSHSKLSLLLSMPLFSSLSSEHLEKVALIAKEQMIDSGTMIYGQGDVGHSIYIIISGQLRVFRTSSSGLETLIANRGPGDSIGEMALLTDEPRSTSVQATEDSLLLIIMKEDFDQLLRDDPDLARVFIKVLMGHLRTSYVKIEHEISQEVALRDFLSEQHHPIDAKLIGTSRKMTALKKEIEEVAAVDGPALVTGEVGTEHATVAQLIHEKSRLRKEVFFIIDCAAIPTLMPLGESREAKERDFIVELSQGSAIFGHEAAIFPFAKAERLGYLIIAHSGTLVLENVDKLQKSVQENLAAYLRDGSLGSNALGSFIVLVVASLATFGVLWAGGIIAIHKSDKLIDRFNWLALAFIPLAFAGELSHQLARLLLWAGQLMPILGRQIGVDYLQKLGIQATPIMVHGFQVMVVLSGAIITLIVGKRTISDYTDTQSKAPIWILRTLVLALSVTYLMFFFQGEL